MAKPKRQTRALVTLLTDFGWQDPYVGAMKGQLLRYAPHAEIIDVSHDVPAHDIVHAAFLLAGAAPYFPAGTLHVVVVDPGVGTNRAVLLGQFSGQLFLFPDNGVISLVQQTMKLEGLIAVRDPRLAGESPSHTFHGRDIFAPIAGQILSGRNLNEFGVRPNSYRLLDLPPVIEEPDALRGQVLYIDHFGNCVTSIRRADLLRRWEDLGAVRVRAGEHELGILQQTYGQVKPSQPLALINSMEMLEVAVNQGRASDVLCLTPGSSVVASRPRIVNA